MQRIRLGVLMTALVGALVGASGIDDLNAASSARDECVECNSAQECDVTAIGNQGWSSCEKFRYGGEWWCQNAGAPDCAATDEDVVIAADGSREVEEVGVTTSPQRYRDGGRASKLCDGSLVSRTASLALDQARVQSSQHVEFR